jgi:hypothetical protein
MANKDAAFGLLTFGNVLRATWYPLATTYAASLFHGSLIQSASTQTGLVCKALGGDTRQSVTTCTTGAAGLVLGAALGFMDSDGDPIAYFPTGTVGDGVVGGYVLVADHPDQTFIAQEDGTTTPIAAASAGLNVAMTAESGSTTKGTSTQELDSDSVNTTATLPLRLVRSYRDDIVAATGCRYIVIINPNASFYASATAV